MENKQPRDGAWKELIQEFKTNVFSSLHLSSDIFTVSTEISGLHFAT